MKSFLTPSEFLARVDQIYDTARSLVIRDGHALETITLLNARGKAYFFTNDRSVPYRQRQDEVRGLIRMFHACAAISVNEAWLAWHTQGRAPEVDAMRPSDRPDREDALVVQGTWPVMGVCHLRCASIIRPAAGPPDLVEVDLAGVLQAADLPPQGTMASTSWLTDLLPRH